MVTATDVVVHYFERQGHKDCAPMPMHNRFGQARGAAGINDPQRMVKGQPHRLKALHGLAMLLGGLRHAHRAGHLVAGQVGGAQVVMNDHMLHGRQSVHQLLNHAHAVMVAATIRDPVDCNQDLGLDLFEPIEHRQSAHIGCANAPDTPNADGGQKGNHGLGNIGQISGDAVAWLDALRLQMQGQ